MKNVLNIVLGMTLVASGQSSYAASLKELLPSYQCPAEEMALEPLQLRSTLIESRWKTAFVTASARALFDAAKVNELKTKSSLQREEMSTSHVIQEIDRRTEVLRSSLQRAITAGTYLPVEDGKTYSREEMTSRSATQFEFKKRYVEPMYRESYKFVESELRKRQTSPSTAVSKNHVNAALLARVEQQRQFLNSSLAQTLPSLVSKIGQIRAGTPTDLPFSYRDGHIVKMRFARNLPDGSTQELTLYPRQLINQLEGRDYFFLQTLEQFALYSRTQFLTAQEAQTGTLSRVRRLLEYIVPVPALAVEADRLRVRKSIAELTARDLLEAKRTHTILSTLSDREILSLLDLFKSLIGEDVPKCGSVITRLNVKVNPSLANRKSSSDRLDPMTKANIDRLGKDIVFYQDIYGTFSEAASFVISKLPVARK